LAARERGPATERRTLALPDRWADPLEPLIGTSWAARLACVNLTTLGDVRKAEESGQRWWFFAPNIGQIRSREIVKLVDQALGGKSVAPSTTKPSAKPSMRSPKAGRHEDSPRRSPDSGLAEVLGQRTADRVRRAGMETLNDLASAIDLGHPWWGLARGIGPKRAAVIEATAREAMAGPTDEGQPPANTGSTDTAQRQSTPTWPLFTPAAVTPASDAEDLHPAPSPTPAPAAAPTRSPTSAPPVRGEDKAPAGPNWPFPRSERSPVWAAWLARQAKRAAQPAAELPEPSAPRRPTPISRGQIGPAVGAQAPAPAPAPHAQHHDPASLRHHFGNWWADRLEFAGLHTLSDVVRADESGDAWWSRTRGMSQKASREVLRRAVEALDGLRGSEQDLLGIGR